MANTPGGILLRHIRKLFAGPGARELPDQQLLERFIHLHDEVAFETLVQRHGPLVLGVCRRVLHHEQDAEDAFQATFLVLAQKAASIHKLGSVSSWLYGVANRIAAKARMNAAKRRSHESQAAGLPTAEPAEDASWRELRSVLDEELQRLPEKYRAPLVLCYLEGKTQDEVARELDWTAGAVKGRLERGRDALRTRLSRRGATLPVALLATLLARKGASATVQAALLDTTVRTATLMVTGQGDSALISVQVARLTAGALRAMLMTKVKVGAVILLLASMAAAGTGMLALGPEGKKPVSARVIYHELAAPSQNQQGSAPKAVVPSVPNICAKLHGHTGRAYCLTFSPDGKVLASGGQDGAVKLWDVATGKGTATLEGHAGSVWAVAFSPDSRTLVAGSGRFDPQRQQYLSGELKIWDVAQRSAKETLQGHAKVVNALAFSPDGKLLASASGDATVKLWDVAGGELKLRQVAYDGAAILPRFRKRPPNAVSSVAFSPDGKLLAWEDNDFAITLWDVAAGQEKARLEGHPGDIRCLTFSPDGKTLASTGLDHTKGGVWIKLWEVLTAKERASFDFTYKQTTCFHSVTFDRTGRTLISGNNEGVVTLWDLVAGKDTTILDDKNIAVYSLKFSPDGAILAAARSDGSLVLWDMAPANKGQHQLVELSRKDFDAQWSELSDVDALRAYRAMCGLIRSPQQTVAFLAQRLQPVPLADRKRLAQLISDLDHVRFGDRETASRELEKLGTVAEPALRKALLGNPSSEVRQRVEQLLKRLMSGTPPPETLRVLRAVEILESIGNPKARQVLESLAKGAPEARLTQEAKASLERLAKRPVGER